ncbi:TMEM175 family protein [Microbacterium sp. DT81.1]|uniref:TMEM175 family protein n=1 Tax=Microbacterium sp. DT81.1 TaxID=3393413 RepID=UPI003CEB0184
MIDRDEDPLEFGRVLSLSDAVFGLAMTLLVVSIVVPPGLSSDEYTAAIGELLPRVAIMALSFAVAASAWIGHRRFFSRVQRIDAGIQWRNFVLLGLVALLPLPHQVLGGYANEPLSYVLYAAVLSAVNVMFVVLELHAARRNLLRPGDSEASHRLEVARGLLDACGFALSIPLAFLVVSWTPLLWVALLPLEALLVRRMQPSGPPLTSPHAE